MRALAALVIFASFSGARALAQPEAETVALQRYLVDVRLGDDLSRVRRIYPPALEWPVVVHSRAGVTRYRVDKVRAKVFPARIETLYFGFNKRNRLVEIEIVYDQKRSRTETVDQAAGEYALVYGKAKHSADRFWWSDRKTVLRVFSEKIPIVKDGENAVAWRTAVQIFDQKAF